MTPEVPRQSGALASGEMMRTEERTFFATGPTRTKSREVEVFLSPEYLEFRIDEDEGLLIEHSEIENLIKHLQSLLGLVP